MDRVLIIGSPGAGKSTFSQKLASVTGLPLIHLDQEFWQPGWKMTPADQWRDKLHEMVAGERWIIDGSYDSSLDIRLPRADTVVFLDYPRWLCLMRVIKRIITGFGRVRPDMGEGCPEFLDLGFIKWIYNYRRDHYSKIMQQIEEYFSHGQLVVLENSSQARAFLRQVSQTTANEKTRPE